MPISVTRQAQGDAIPIAKKWSIDSGVLAIGHTIPVGGRISRRPDKKKIDDVLTGPVCVVGTHTGSLAYHNQVS